MMRGNGYFETFRLLLISAICCLQTVSSGAQSQYRIMDWKTEHTLRSSHLQQMHRIYELRRSRYATALESAEALSSYRNDCRARYLGILGILPERKPLNAYVTGRLLLDGCILEKVVIESRPGHHLTANLYIPAGGEGPFPALLFLCGHEMTSKATPSYQEAARLFAGNGFAVFVVDPVSQGERVQFTDSAGNRILRGSTTEHTLLNAGAIITGTSVAAWELHDNLMALDYLVSRHEIDSDRIGCIGNSGGGAQTMYLIGYDDRIKAAAPCSFITSREREYELNGTGDGCQQIPFEAREGLEIADYLLMFAPRPLLILAGRYDFVDYPGTVDAYHDLEPAYHVFGHPEKISLYTFDDGHGLSAPKREAALLWFRKWLCDDTTSLVRKFPEIEDEQITWCTPEGQVNSHYPDEVTVQESNRQRVKELEAGRSAFTTAHNSGVLLDTLRNLLAVRNSQQMKVTAELRGAIETGGHEASRIILRSEGEVPLPILVINPSDSVIPDTLVLVLGHEGKAIIAGAGGPALNELAANRVVIAADLRGMGETAEKPDANDPKYYNSEYHNAVLGMQLGKPLPGQRVTDILMILCYLGTREEFSRLPVKVIATGPAALPAFLAAILDTRITSLEMYGTIRSFAEITERPMEKDWFSYVVPGILEYFDLPGLALMKPELKIKYHERRFSD